MLHRVSISKLLLTAGLTFGMLLIGSGFSPKAQALSGSDWQAGNIISDSVFFNASGLNTSQIQQFLNSKVPVCDTNGTQIYSGSTTRAQRGASQGYPAPYTCLKDYSQNTPNMPAETALCNAYGGGTKSTAQMIYDISQACGINPGVLLTLLQKEQSLITDDWPWANQYRSATGFGCPDTAPCDDTYGGFFYQVYYAARQFKVYQKNATSYNYRAGRNNNVLYNPSSSCGSSSVYIQNQASAGLYTYTPYQPNQAALNNLYGSGDSCSAYGNRNFWRLFTDWFGPTTDGDSYFAVTDKDPNNNQNVWYLITPKGRYMIPSLEVYYAWGLNKYAFQPVSQAYFNSIPDGGTLGRNLKDRYDNYFFVDNGQTHYVRNPTYLSLWGMTGKTTVQSTGLAYALPGGNWTGRFMTDISTGDKWLMDGATKHAIAANSSLLYQWGYVGDQVTSVTSDYLDSIPTGSPLAQTVTYGSNRFVVDSGQVSYFDDPNVQSAFSGEAPITLTNIYTLSYLPLKKASVFVSDASTGKWYMLEGGKKHYVSSLEQARIWGYQPGQALTNVTANYLSNYTDGGTLANVVQTTSPSQKWVIDGKKHLLSSTSAANAWTPSGASLPTYSGQSLNMLSTGADATTLVQPQGAPFVYTMDGGNKRYLPLPIIANAWGYPKTSQITALSPSLVNTIPETAPISVVVKNQTTYYLLMDGAAYPIKTENLDSWGASGATPVLSDASFSRFTVSSKQLGAYIKVDGTYYVMHGLYATPVTNYSDAYGITDANAVALPFNYFATTDPASFLIKSTDTGDVRVWLMNRGQKILLSSFAQQANFGYISQGVTITSLTPGVIASIPTSGDVPSLLVNKSGSGVKLLSFGSALGFPDGPTLTSYVSPTNPILTLSDSVYDRFVLRRDASRLVRDDAGNVYLMENGTKRLIRNRALLQSTYANIRQVYLEGTTMAVIPNGVDVN